MYNSQLKTKVRSRGKQPSPIKPSQTSSFVGIQGQHIKQTYGNKYSSLSIASSNSTLFSFLYSHLYQVSKSASQQVTQIALRHPSEICH